MEHNRDCDCLITKGRKGQKGLWCVKCRRKLYDVETRPCGECKNYKYDLWGGMCVKLLMSVHSSLNVMYLINKGTCFENKN
jgi:hypothetical protein